LRFNLWFNGKNKTVLLHRLVAETFLPNPENLETVNHKDGNKENNHVDNLEWMTYGDNTKDSFTRPHTVCHPVQVRGVTYRSKREAERETGVPRLTFKDGPHFQIEKE
jgi:hypothetical protein